MKYDLAWILLCWWTDPIKKSVTITQLFFVKKPQPIVQRDLQSYFLEYKYVLSQNKCTHQKKLILAITNKLPQFPKNYLKKKCINTYFFLNKRHKFCIYLTCATSLVAQLCLLSPEFVTWVQISSRFGNFCPLSRRIYCLVY